MRRAAFQIVAVVAAWGWLSNPANAYSFSYTSGDINTEATAYSWSADGTYNQNFDIGLQAKSSAGIYGSGGSSAMASAEGSVEVDPYGAIVFRAACVNSNNYTGSLQDPVTETRVITRYEPLIFKIVRDHPYEFLPVKVNFALGLQKKGDPLDVWTRGIVRVGDKYHPFDSTDLSELWYFDTWVTRAGLGDEISIDIDLRGQSHPGPHGVHYGSGELLLDVYMYHYKFWEGPFPWEYDLRYNVPLYCEDGEFALLNLRTGGITTIPLPPSCWLLASGLLGLGGLARRKKQVSL